MKAIDTIKNVHTYTIKTFQAWFGTDRMYFIFVAVKVTVNVFWMKTSIFWLF